MGADALDPHLAEIITVGVETEAVIPTPLIADRLRPLHLAGRSDASCFSSRALPSSADGVDDGVVVRR